MLTEKQRFKMDELSYELRHEDAMINKLPRKTQETLKTFPVMEVVAVACSIFRTHGYSKKFDVIGTDKKSNSQLIYSHFFTPDKWSADVTQQDQESADEIVTYLKGLSFKAMERGLTDFETNVLKFVTAPEVNKSSLGIAASLPQVYKGKLSQDAWAEREKELAEVSEFLGTVKSRADFEATIENVRFISRTNSYLYCASVDGKHILKFFSDQDLGKVGEVLCMSGYVKSHEISNYHDGKETMINRLKIHVTDAENSEKKLKNQ